MKILIVDDESNLRRMLRSLLEEAGYRVLEAGNSLKGLALLTDDEPDVVLLDVVMPGVTGLEALPRYVEALPGTPVIMMSGEATLSDAARATREGAFHFLEKPLSPESLLATIRGALEVSRARALSRTLQEELSAGDLLVGKSAVMERVRETIGKVAPTEARVLIVGESGTGKELAATAIHEMSPRRAGPFVRVNSAAIPRELVESEMFGYERGAFTGADQRRLGRFEVAHRGTLFLDEVGDLGAEAQGKLLRVLENRTLERLGGRESIEVDVRVLAATNRDLHEDVASGRFREDLLFRLNVVPLRMPPLRDRPEDIPLLLDHVGARLLRRQGLRLPEVSPEAMRELTEYSWPGNVREFMNFLERLSILHPGERVERGEVRTFLDPRRNARPAAAGSDGSASLAERIDAFEAGLIRETLEGAEGNVAEAARRLRTDRANLYRRMRRLGLRASTD